MEKCKINSGEGCAGRSGEAETVRLIYRLFMQRQTPYTIAKYLTDRNIPTPTGKETWRHRTVENILSNEKYKGDARLQKCYTVDFLSKKRKANEGEVPQYYVEGSYDAIIEPAGNISAPKSGTPTASISGRYDSATPSSKVIAGVPRPICTSSG